MWTDEVTTTKLGAGSKPKFLRPQSMMYREHHKYLFNIQVKYNYEYKYTLIFPVKYISDKERKIGFRLNKHKEFRLVQPIHYTRIEQKEGKVKLTHVRLKEYLDAIF